MTGLYGVRKNVIHGEVVKGDDIPDSDIDESEFGYLDNIVSERATETEETKKKLIMHTIIQLLLILRI